MRENIEDYRRRMWDTYLISITDDYSYKGFIKHGGAYTAKFPEIRDGVAFVGRGYEPTYIIHAIYAQDLQSRVNQWLRSHPTERDIFKRWRETCDY